MAPRIKTLVTALVVGALLAGCASISRETKVSSRIAKPPSMESMSILPMDVGPQSEETFVLDQVRGVMLGRGFDVLDRENVPNLLGEVEFSLSGLTEKSNRVELGRLANANTLGLLEQENTGNATRLSVKLLGIETGKYYYTFDFLNEHNAKKKNRLLNRASLVTLVLAAGSLITMNSVTQTDEFGNNTPEYTVAEGSLYNWLGLTAILQLTKVVNNGYGKRKMDSIIEELDRDLKKKWRRKRKNNEKLP